MSDLSDQLAEFQQKWMQQQQRMLDEWFSNMQGMGGNTPPTSWQQAIDALEQQVNGALDIQKQSLMTLTENSGHMEGVPESFKQWCQQMEEGIEQWNEVQHRLWQTWFDLLRAASPDDEKPQDMFAKGWQDFADRTMQIQKQWLSGWAEMQPAAAKTPAKKSKRRTSASTDRSGNEEQD